MTRNIFDAADDMDQDFNPADRARMLNRIASFARSHSGIKARVTRAGSVLVVGTMGEIKSVKTMRAVCEWLGY